MDAECYRIIITGERVGGFCDDEVVAHLASLFKQPTEHIAKLFGNQPIPLTKPYPADKVEKIRRLFLDIGVLTRVEPITPEGSVPTAQAEPPRAAPQEYNAMGVALRRARFITLSLFLLLLLGTGYLLLEQPLGKLPFKWLALAGGDEQAVVAAQEVPVPPVVPEEPSNAALRRAYVANGSMPFAVVTSEQGTTTFFNMNVLSTGIKLAVVDPAITVEPGMDRAALIERFELPERVLQDGWGKPMWLSVDKRGITIASAGPDGALKTDDDMVMYRALH